MRIGKVYARNFASYPELDFNFCDLGLCLVSGDTGAGKSTLMDAVAWGLFGITSKDGAADDVRAWGGDAQTMVRIEIALPGCLLVVRRIRGKSTENDLAWFESQLDHAHRGKNMVETQQLLEERLGITADQFLNGAYVTQFSDGGRFYYAKAKERREILDKIADISFPNAIAEAVSASRKSAKKVLEQFEQAKAKAEGELSATTTTVQELIDQESAWHREHNRRLEELWARSVAYEKDRGDKIYKLDVQINELQRSLRPDSVYEEQAIEVTAQLDAANQWGKERSDLMAQASAIRAKVQANAAQITKLNWMADQCPTCLGPAHNQFRDAELIRLDEVGRSLQAYLRGFDRDILLGDAKSGSYDDLNAKLKHISNSRHTNDTRRLQHSSKNMERTALVSGLNPHEEMHKTALGHTNPYTDQLTRYEEKLKSAAAAQEAQAQQVEDQQHKITSLDWLYTRAGDLRGMMLQRAVHSLNVRITDILERFFDATLRVVLSLDGDSLEVAMTNNGYDCKFAQLSGGERAQLKLATAVALLEASQDSSGYTSGLIMFDEVLNGMDNELKRKAFGVFQELEKNYSTVLLIDHAEEIKGLFDREFHVVKNGSHSEIQG